MSVKFKEKAVFFGLTRDVESFLPHIFKNIESLGKMFSKSVFVFLENDSVDRTKAILSKWCRSQEQAQIISLDGLSQQITIRTARLAFLRNRAIVEIRKNFKNFDFAFFIDCDESNSQSLNVDPVKSGIKFLKSNDSYSGIFANSRPDYYDYWALRHKDFRPDDVWSSIIEEVFLDGSSEEAAFKKHFLDKVFSITPDKEPIEVDSAFGGLGIYKISHILRHSNSYLGTKVLRVGEREIGLSTCEHVSFNSGFIQNGGKLFIFPSLINRSYNITEQHFDSKGIVGSLVFAASDAYAFSNLSQSENELSIRDVSCFCGSGKKYKYCHGANS